MKQENIAAIVAGTIGLFTGLALGQSKIQKQRELEKQQAFEIARLKLEADTLDAKIAELTSAKIEPKVIEQARKTLEEACDLYWQEHASAEVICPEVVAELKRRGKWLESEEDLEKYFTE